MHSFGKGSHGRLGHNSEENQYEPKLIESLQNVVYISAGCRHASCSTIEGCIYAWGFNFYEQLGLGESDKDYDIPNRIPKLSNSKVKEISCGYFHTGCLVE